MNSTLKKTLTIGIPLLLGVFLMWYAFKLVPFEDQKDYFLNANYSWIALALFFGILSHISRAYRWRFQLEPMGYNIKLSNSIMAVFGTYLINYTIPRAGEVFRAGVVAKYEGVPFEKGFGTIIAERVADMLIMLLIIGITLILQFDLIYNFLIETFSITKMLIGASILGTITVVFFLFVKKSSHKFAVKIRSFVYGLIEGASSIFKMKKKWAFIFHTLFIWTMYIMMFYVTTFAIEELNEISFAAVLIGFIFASFSIAATNGGMGSYPIAIWGAFSIFNIAKEPSIGFGTIMWTSQTIMIALFGGISLILLPIYNRKK